MLRQRTTVVHHVKTKVVTICSNIQIGDSAHVRACVRALAVQREKQIFFGNEGTFSHHIFKNPLPEETAEKPITFEAVSLQPIIKVDNIDITSISSSALLHLGNSRNIMLESRVKHIRDLRGR